MTEASSALTVRSPSVTTQRARAPYIHAVATFCDFFLIILFYFIFIYFLRGAVDEAGLTASFRAHVNITLFIIIVVVVIIDIKRFANNDVPQEAAQRIVPLSVFLSQWVCNLRMKPGKFKLKLI